MHPSGTPFTASAPLVVAQDPFVQPSVVAAPPVFAAQEPAFVAAPVFHDNGDLNPGDQAEFEERAEYLEDYWQYSKFALPCLLFIGILTLILIFLSIWQMAGDVKDYHDGVARHISHPVVEAVDDDGGIERGSRHFRAFFIGVAFVAPIIAFLAYFLRPKPGIRKGLVALAAVLLIIAAVLAWIAFGKAMEPEGGLETGSAVVDAALGTVALIAAILLIVNGVIKSHWRMAPRSFEEEQEDLAREKAEVRVPGEMIHKNVSWVRKGLITIFLIATFLLALAATILLLATEAHRDAYYNQDQWGRFWELEGWHTVNTRFRFIALGIAFFVLILNFMPFRSRTAAYIFGFLYLIAAGILFIAFWLDVEQIEDDKDLTCPNDMSGRKLDCDHSHFELTAVLEILLFVSLIGYLVIEYAAGLGKIRKPIDPVHRP